MRIQIQRSPDSVFFGTWSAHPKAKDIRDIGDYVIWFAGWEFTFWWKPPYFKKKGPR